MKLLVTGGSGFIGSNLVRYILEKENVELLVNLDALTYAGHPENLLPVDRDPRYRFEKVDIRDRDGVSRVIKEYDISDVMHLAAESHVDRSINDPGAFVHTNVTGTFHLLEACRAYWQGHLADHRFHHISTDEVYGTLGETGFFTEETPYAPNSPYSASKASSDMMVRAYHHTYGMNTVITNCSNNYGPYQFPEKLIPVVIQSLLNGRPVPVYGDGRNVRDWLYVEDHAEALWLVLNAGRPGETYNIGGHNEWANIDIVKLICDLVDEFKGASQGTSRKLIEFVKDRPGHDRRYAIDAGKIQRKLGWTPQHSFEAGISKTVRWYLDHQDWVRAVTAKKA